MSGPSAALGSATLHSAPAAARLALCPGRLGSAQLCAPQRRRAGPAAAPRSAPLAPRRSAPARCPLRAAPCLARAFLGPPAGPLPGPSGFARALAVLRGRSRAGCAPAPSPLLPEFRLGRATWLPAAPQAPDADAGLYLVRLSLPPLVRTAVAAAERHGPMDPAGHAPSVCRHLPLCGEHLESPCASVFGGKRGGERGTERRRRERDWGPDCACASGLFPPSQPPPAAACAVWGCFQSTPNSIHFSASVHPPAPGVHTPQAESQALALPLHCQPGRPPALPGRPLVTPVS